MQPPDPTGRPHGQPKAGDPDLPVAEAAFQGFRSLTANFTQTPNEIWDMRMPGYTTDLRHVLFALTRETVGDAYRRGGSPYDFKAISWARWKELLDLQSTNAVKSRLARAEELGLIEVLPGERGPWGTTPNQYRLRWANDGRAASRTFRGVIHGRFRQLSRKRQARAGGYQPADTRGGSPANPPLTPGYQPTDTPLTPCYQPADTPPADTPRVSVQADTPSFKHTEYLGTTLPFQSVSPSVPEEKGLTDRLPEIEIKNTDKNQSVRQSVPAEKANETNTDGLTDRIPRLNFNLGLWLKSAEPEPWPETLLSRLAVILDPPQMAGIAKRSPWSAEGASAILQAIQVKGRRLGNQAGTLWNALLQTEKGAGWLAKASGLPGQEGTRKAAGERGPAKVRPSPTEAMPKQERHVERTCHEKEKFMVHQVAAPVLRPQEFSPERKAELRSLIEAFRHATRALKGAHAADNRAAIKAFSQAWDSVLRVLEPLLPLQVTLPDEYQPTEIHSRSQIKTNVVTAVYRDVS